MSVGSGDVRRLTVRRSLVGRSGENRTLLRVMRVWLVRRVLFLGALLIVICLAALVDLISPTHLP